MVQLWGQIHPSCSSDSGSSSDVDDDTPTQSEADSWRSARLTQSFGAPLGPSIAMCNAVLDCLAVTAAAADEAYTTNGSVRLVRYRPFRKATAPAHLIVKRRRITRDQD